MHAWLLVVRWPSSLRRSQMLHLANNATLSCMLLPPTRRLVEGIISGLQSDAAAAGGEDEEGGSSYLLDDAVPDAGGWASLDAPPAAAGVAGAGEGPRVSLQEHAAALVEELMLLGFRQQDAAAAVAAVAPPGGAGAAEGVSLSDALDWLCVRLPEERLPKNFAPGGCRLLKLRLGSRYLRASQLVIPQGWLAASWCGPASAAPTWRRHSTFALCLIFRLQEPLASR